MRPQSAVIAFLVAALVLPQWCESAVARKAHKHKSHRSLSASHRAAHKHVVKSKAGTAQPPVTAGAAATPKPRLMSRAEILNTDPQRLASLGRHIIVGYHQLSDVKALVKPVLGHRISLTADAWARGVTAGHVVDELLGNVAAPLARQQVRG